MTAFELNAQVYYNLGYIANNESRMKKVLDLLMSFRKEDQENKEIPIKRIHVKRNQSSSLDQFAGIFSSSRSDDEKAREEYMKDKYSKYL